MKKILVVLLSLFLLSAFGCETTSQNVASEAPKVEAVEEPFAGDFDLSGTWTMNEAITAPQCGGNKKSTSTVEIAQTGEEVSAVDNSKENWSWKGKAYKNFVAVAEKTTGKVTVEAYKLVVSPDGNTVTAKIDWVYDRGVCDGVSNVTYTRK